MSIRRLVSRLRAALRGGRLDRDLDAEVSAHLELAAEEFVRRGYPPDDARAAARRAFGGVESMKEHYRDVRGLPLIDALRQDVRYALRMLRKTPVVTTVVLVSLALAIGANTAVFSVINGLLLRTLPVNHPESLVSVAARRTGQQVLLSFPMYRDLRAGQQVFVDIMATAGETPTRLTIPSRSSPTDATELDNMRISFVSGNYFDVVGVAPAIGRFFTADDDRNPATSESLGSVIVLSDGFWARQFGRDPDVLGRTVIVGRSACRVIGVAPAGFTGEAIGYSPVGWVPLVPFTPSEELENRRGTITSYMGRLRSGVTREQAQTSMTRLFQQLLATERRVTDDTRVYSIALDPAGTGLDYSLRRRFARPLLIIMAMVATVLLIACTNVANLLLARAAARRAEIGVRLAIGCSRRRLIAQLLTESLVLSVFGAAAAVALAYWGSQALLQMVSAGPVPINLDVTPDLRVLAFLLATTIATGLAFGIVPAVRATRVDLSPSLYTAVRSDAARPSRHRLSRALVTCQVALSLLLLVGAGLLIRTLHNLHTLDWGFRPERVVIFDLAHNPQNREPTAMSRAAWDVYSRVRQVAGVDSVSLSGLLIFSPSNIGTGFQIPDDTMPSSEPRAVARFNAVSPGYFQTVGMTLVDGRGIEDRDTLSSPVVIVVNETFARRYLQRGAVGRMIKVNIGRRGDTPAEVVGVVADAKYNDLREPAEPMFYIPIMQWPRSLRSLEVRTRQPVSAIAAPVRTAIASVNKDVMIRRIVSLTDQVDQSLAGERLLTRLASAFGGLALLLACVGLYGVMSYIVAQRTNELGIRIALGATRGSVQWLVLRETLFMVGAGIVVGLPLSFAAARLVTKFLYGLTATDPFTLLLATLVLGASAALAAYLPARRAARVDPIRALRYE